MSDTIDFLRISSKLPGYLFILANMTTPGDIIYLNCPEEDKAFLSSMLAQIGLSVQSCIPYSEGITPKPIILNICKDLHDIRPNESNDEIEIYLLPYQIPMRQFEQCARDILFRYPDLIIIDELQDRADVKTFSIALSKENHHFTQLTQKIGRFKLN